MPGSRFYQKPLWKFQPNLKKKHISKRYLWALQSFIFFNHDMDQDHDWIMISWIRISVRISIKSKSLSSVFHIRRLYLYSTFLLKGSEKKRERNKLYLQLPKMSAVFLDHTRKLLLLRLISPDGWCEVSASFLQHVYHLPRFQQFESAFDLVKKKTEWTFCSKRKGYWKK